MLAVPLTRLLMLSFTLYSYSTSKQLCFILEEKKVCSIDLWHIPQNQSHNTVTSITYTYEMGLNICALETVAC